MKRNLVKLVTVVLMICLCVSTFAGCGKKEETVSSSDTIKIFTNIKNRPDCALVSQEISKITREELGFDVEFMFGYNADKIALMLASNEQMDIGFDNSATFVDRVRQNVYVDITDMLEEKAPKLYEAVPKELWEGSKVDGRNYAVPTYKEFAEQWSVLVDQKIIDEHNIDISNMKELKDIEPILAALKEHPERAGFEIRTASNLHLNLALKNKYDVVYDNYVVKRDDPEKVVHFMETQEYKDFVYLMRDWFNKGYIASDIATRTEYDAYDFSGNIGVTYTSYHPYLEKQLSQTYGVELTPIHVTPITTSNTSMMGSLFGIYSKSKNVDKALAFLELWNTDPRIKNLVTYGIEGKHYEKISDNKIKRVDGALDMYKMDNATSGNVMISYLLDTEPDDKYEAFNTFNNNAIAAKTLGFSPDVSEIKSKIAACSNAVDEFNSLLSVGAIDPEEYLDKMLTNIKNAGNEDVKAVLQKQYDEWRK